MQHDLFTYLTLSGPRKIKWKFGIVSQVIDCSWQDRILTKITTEIITFSFVGGGVVSTKIWIAPWGCTIKVYM